MTLANAVWKVNYGKAPDTKPSSSSDLRFVSFAFQDCLKRQKRTSPYYQVVNDRTTPAAKTLPRSLSREIGRKSLALRVAASTGSLPPLPRQHWLRISPQSLQPLSRLLFEPFQHRIPRRILSIPPAPVIFDQSVIDIGAV